VPVQVSADGKVCRKGYPVKADIPARGQHKGKKVYYTPGDRDYGDVEAVACFATEEAAQAAGFVHLIR
jgi:hypothetical protein